MTVKKTEGQVGLEMVCRQLRRRPQDGTCNSCQEELRTMLLGIDQASKFLGGLGPAKTDEEKKLLLVDYGRAFQIATAFAEGLDRPYRELQEVLNWMKAVETAMEVRRVKVKDYLLLIHGQRPLTRAAYTAMRKGRLLEIEDIWIQRIDRVKEDDPELKYESLALARGMLQTLTERFLLNASAIWDLALNQEKQPEEMNELKRSMSCFPVSIDVMLEALREERRQHPAE